MTSPIKTNKPAAPARRAVGLTQTSLVGLLALLAGCTAVGPDYREPDLAAPTAWLGASRIQTTAAGDLSRWWDQLGDPTLSRLIERAIQGSPDLRIAQGKLRQARARRGVAGAARFPTLTAAGGTSRARSGSASEVRLYSAELDAGWEADVFGGVRRGVEAADADLLASVADLHNTQVSLVAEVALNYVELRAFQARLQIARDSLAAQSETLQLTDWRAQAGLTSSLEVEQARTSRAQTRASIPTLEEGVVETRNRLSILTGQAPGAVDALLATVTPVPAIPEVVTLGIPAETLRQRPDVRAAERRAAAETARVGVTTAARYPSFHLSGSLGVDALTLAGLSGGGTIARSLAASVAGTLFDGGRLAGLVEAQDAVREQALGNYEKTVLAALEDVENALSGLATGRERELALRDAATAARNAALLARQRYSAGVVNFQSVLDVERTLLTVEDSLANATAQRATSLIQLYKALGGGWTAASASESAPAAAAVANAKEP